MRETDFWPIRTKVGNDQLDLSGEWCRLADNQPTDKMAQGFQIDGKIHLINEIQTFDSGFSKREFVVETVDGQYPQMIKFECVKDRTALTDGLNQGDQVTVHFDIRGNEYQGRYFVNLNAWKLERAGAGGGQPQAQPPQGTTTAEPYPGEAPAGFDEGQGEEEIPF